MLRNFSVFLPLLLFFSSVPVLGLHKISDGDGTQKWIGRRGLFGFKETPSGSNATFECSLSGPCIACLYSEKNDENYRCSETGYRIPLKCSEIKQTAERGGTSRKGRSMLEMIGKNIKLIAVRSNVGKPSASITHRDLLGESTSLDGTSQTYITYRSCIPPINEEKFSVLGFEGVVLCLFLVSGSVVYFRRKRAMSSAGFGRIQTNSRF